MLSNIVKEINCVLHENAKLKWSRLKKICSKSQSFKSIAKYPNLKIAI